MNEKHHHPLEKAVALIFGMLFIAAIAYLGTTVHRLGKELQQQAASQAETDRFLSAHIDRTAADINDRLKSTQQELRQSIQQVKTETQLTQKALIYALADRNPQQPPATTAATDSGRPEFEPRVPAANPPAAQSPTAAATAAEPAAPSPEYGTLAVTAAAPAPEAQDEPLAPPRVIGTTIDGRPVYASARPDGSLIVRRSDRRKMPVRFAATPLETVIAALRDVSGLNFALDEGIEEKTTLILERQISWERLLNILLLRYNLEIENHGQQVLLVRSGTRRG